MTVCAIFISKCDTVCHCFEQQSKSKLPNCLLWALSSGVICVPNTNVQKGFCCRKRNVCRKDRTVIFLQSTNNLETVLLSNAMTQIIKPTCVKQPKMKLSHNPTVKTEPNATSHLVSHSIFSGQILWWPCKRSFLNAITQCCCPDVGKSRIANKCPENAQQNEVPCVILKQAT